MSVNHPQVTVRCATCHRTEVWRPSRLGKEIEVLAPGGQRRPMVPAPLHLARVLLRARRGESGPVVGACSACTHPMLAEDGPWTPLPMWAVETREGELRFGPAIEGPHGTMSDDEAEQWIEAQYQQRWTARDLVQSLHGLALTFFLFPVALWAVAVVFTATFLLGSLPYFWPWR
jgi:hypothetical protein